MEREKKVGELEETGDGVDAWRETICGVSEGIGV